MIWATPTIFIRLLANALQLSHSRISMPLVALDGNFCRHVLGVIQVQLTNIFSIECAKVQLPVGPCCKPRKYSNTQFEVELYLACYELELKLPSVVALI